MFFMGKQKMFLMTLKYVSNLCYFEMYTLNKITSKKLPQWVGILIKPCFSLRSWESRCNKPENYFIDRSNNHTSFGSLWLFHTCMTLKFVVCYYLYS